MIRIVVGVVGVVLVLADCTRDRTVPGAAGVQAAVAAPVIVPVIVSSDAALSGTVVETMSSGGYTYARLDRGGARVWVAGPEAKLAVGATLGPLSGTLMVDYHSRTLDRTFDQIYFVESLGPTATSATAWPSATVWPIAPGERIAAAPDGKTVADVFAHRDALAGRPVAVRGRVVKLNSGIMNRNWIHLRDGTGGAGANDLLVTSTQTAQLGDIVVARGIVATHQDFGAGYAYDVLVERATIASK